MQFGLNRPMVREGLRLLEQNGRVLGRRAAVCIPPANYDVVPERMARTLALQELTFCELYAVTGALEVASIDGDIDYATDADTRSMA